MNETGKTTFGIFPASQVQAATWIGTDAFVGICSDLKGA